MTGGSSGAERPNSRTGDGVSVRNLCVVARMQPRCRHSTIQPARLGPGTGRAGSSSRFCPLGWPGEERHRLLTDPVLASLAARLGATPAQIALSWLLDLAPNILLIPGTRNRAHLAENLGASAVRFDAAARAELTRHLPLGRVGGR